MWILVALTYAQSVEQGERAPLTLTWAGTAGLAGTPKTGFRGHSTSGMGMRLDLLGEKSRVDGDATVAEEGDHWSPNGITNFL